MRNTLLLLAIIAALCLPALAEESIAGAGDFSGTVVLWFSGTSVTAQVGGEIALSGTLTVDGVDTAFTAEGTVTGSGVGDTNTLALGAWVTFVSHGTLATDTPITLRGGIELTTDSLDLSSETAGSGTGTLHVAVTVSGETQYLSGTVTGLASGGFVPPDDPTTMQMTGTGTFTLVATPAPPEDVSPSDQGSVGSSTDDGVPLPWKLDTWPEDMRKQLIDLMGEE